MNIHTPRAVSVKSLLIETTKMAIVCALYAFATLGFIVIMGGGQ